MLAYASLAFCEKLFSKNAKKNFSLDVFRQEKAKTKILTVLKRMQQEGEFHGLIQNMKLCPGVWCLKALAEPSVMKIP